MSLTRISTPEDFPNVVVYEAPGQIGPRCVLTFRNLEMGSTAALVMKGFIGVALFSAALFGAIPAIGVAYGIHPLLALAVPCAMTFGYFALKPVLSPPFLVERAIELNPDTGTLRVCRKGEIEIERRLTSLVNLTVEPHPEAEYKRMRRMEKNETRLYAEEKTHCLFGWFGEGGAEKVLLVPRVEWPSHNSLFEVRQALLWALARVAAPAKQAMAAEEAAEGVGPYKPARASRAAGGINPPLD